MTFASVAPEEAPAAGAVLARAFLGDPLTCHIFPEAGERARRALSLFTSLARYDALFGRVDRLDDYDAVATWLTPGDRGETPERLAQAGVEPLERLDTFYTFVGRAHERAVSEPHWYLRLLGVDAAAQGRGLGGRLLEYGLARASESGYPTFLETFAERNVAFYLRHGFQLALDEVEPTSGIRCWGFLHQ